MSDPCPQDLYRRAALFDRAGESFAEIGDELKATLREIDAIWRRAADHRTDLSDDVVSTDVRRMLHLLAGQDYGAPLRRAGDALAEGQARLRDLVLRRDQHHRDTPAAGLDQYDQEAQAILAGVSQRFAEIGEELPRPPVLTVLGNPVHNDDSAPPPLPPLIEQPATGGGTAATGGPTVVDARDHGVIGRDRVTLLSVDSASASVPDTPSTSMADPSGFPGSPSSPAAAAPMMPFMPMGMGMGGMGMGTPGAPASRQNRPGVNNADPQTWEETEDGWGVLGRQPPPRPPAPPGAHPPSGKADPSTPQTPLDLTRIVQDREYATRLTRGDRNG
jgi:hypothetical protein